jgi:Protein of unknown function (DUF3551)
MQQRDSAMHLEWWPAITALSTFFYTDGAASLASHVLCAIHANRRKTHTERDEMKTKQLLKISAAPAAMFCALAFFSTATPATAAQVDYCRTDTSGMRGCGYSSLEQCQAMASGRGSNCYENPFPEGASAKASSSNASGAYAYQPKHKAAKGARKPVEHQ